MLEESSFNLGSGKSVAGNIDYVVDTTTNPVVSFVITASSITSELQKLISMRICITVRDHSRSSPCTRSGMYPCIACEHPRRYEPCWAMVV